MVVGIKRLYEGHKGMEKWKDNPARPRLRYPATQLKQLVWRVRDVEEIPVGFDRATVNNPDDLLRYSFLFKDLPNERVVVFVLNANNGVVAVDIATEGTLNACLIHPREVFRAAVMGVGSAIIVAHNHPSDNPEPSNEDVNVTRQLREAGKVLGIPLHDHVIMYNNGRSYTSMAERGLV